MADQLLTTREVAQACNVTPQTVWRWIDRGALAAVRLPSGRLRVAVDELAELQRERTAVTPRHGAMRSDRRPA